MTDGSSRRLRPLLVALVALAPFALTACATGSGPGPSNTPTTAGLTTVQSTAAPASTSAPASPTPSASSPTPTKTATAHPTPTPTKLPADYCQAGQLTMRILPGGAEPNYEIAAVTFTNDSSTSCSIMGYPAVQLLLKGSVLSTAKPNTAHAPKLVHLGPGAQAEAQISDHITCQAPLSDLIRATAPAPLTSLHLESKRSLVQMRGCAVTIDPVVLSS